jgi:hypothetical protein
MRLRPKVAAKLIRFALKKKCKTLHVKLARGTAYGWIDIWAGNYWEFTEEEKKALEYFGLPHGGNCCVISPEDTAYWIEKICEKMPEAHAFLIADQIKQ